MNSKDRKASNFMLQNHDTEWLTDQARGLHEWASCWLVENVKKYMCDLHSMPHIDHFISCMYTVKLRAFIFGTVIKVVVLDWPWTYTPTTVVKRSFPKTYVKCYSPKP